MLLDTILRLYFSWFLGLKTTPLLMLFPSHSWLHRHRFNEQNDYYQRIIYVSNAATWGKADSNLTGISESLSFGFSIPSSRVFFLFLYVEKLWWQWKNVHPQQTSIAVAFSEPHCGKCALPAVWDLTPHFPEMGSPSKTGWQILSAFILLLGLASVNLIFRTVPPCGKSLRQTQCESLLKRYHPWI